MPNPVLPNVPGRRAGEAEIEAQARLLETVPAIARILDAVPALAVVLNRDRQIVLANQSAARFTGARDPGELRGLRPGEILDCVHARETPEGCGTTEACSVCGALRAVGIAQTGHATTQHCRIVRRTNAGEELLEIELSASPLELAGELFTLVSGVDASDRERLHWFERTVVPQATALAAELEILTATVSGDGSDTALRAAGASRLLAASRRLTSLLRETSEMAEAEAGGYACARLSLPAAELLVAAAGEAANQEAATGRSVVVESAEGVLPVETDPVLARRVLEKMLLNALEATAAGGVVRLGCRAAGDAVELWIHNTGEIPRQAQFQMFQRSWSTKGPGRGYGTYFIKLMTERCLGGTISFRSTGEDGTTFSLRLPAAR
jgi:hypothetical protein